MGLLEGTFCTARKGVRVCGVKNALWTAEERKSWRKMRWGGFGENTHELEKNAKPLEKINTIIIWTSDFHCFGAWESGQRPRLCWPPGHMCWPGAWTWWAGWAHERYCMASQQSDWDRKGLAIVFPWIVENGHADKVIDFASGRGKGLYYLIGLHCKFAALFAKNFLQHRK